MIVPQTISAALLSPILSVRARELHLLAHVQQAIRRMVLEIVSNMVCQLIMGAPMRFSIYSIL